VPARDGKNTLHVCFLIVAQRARIVDDKQIRVVGSRLVRNGFVNGKHIQRLEALYFDRTNLAFWTRREMPLRYSTNNNIGSAPATASRLAALNGRYLGEDTFKARLLGPVILNLF